MYNNGDTSDTVRKLRKTAYSVTTDETECPHRRKSTLPEEATESTSDNYGYMANRTVEKGFTRGLPTRTTHPLRSGRIT